MSIHFVFVLVFAFLIRQASRDAWWIGSWLRLPGTLAHELAHLVFGFLANAKPERFIVFPKLVGKNIVLGEVRFLNITWYNAALTGMAPLILAFAALFLDRQARTLHDPLTNLLAVFAEANLLLACVPSRTDFKVAARYSVFPVVLIAAFVFWDKLR